MEIQLEVFRRDNKEEVRKHQQVILDESHFKQFIQLREPIVVATDDFCKRRKLTTYGNLTPVQRFGRTIEACAKSNHNNGKTQKKNIATMKK